MTDRRDRFTWRAGDVVVHKPKPARKAKTKKAKR